MTWDVAGVQAILDKVEFHDWKFTAFPIGDRVGFEATAITKNAYFPEDDWDFVTREWLISEYADEAMIVRTAWTCVLHGIGHEAREWFKFNGERVMSPHAYGPGHEEGIVELSVSPLY